MRLTVIDPKSRFSCACCGDCCRQPYRVVIDARRAALVRAHDFSAYPLLASRALLTPAADGRPDAFDLAKRDDGACLFLDADGLCIIHKELGADAKPQMCRQFPFLPSRALFDDRLSASFGCPSVQQRRGTPLREQSDELRAAVTLPPLPVRSDVHVAFDSETELTAAEFESLSTACEGEFAAQRGGDIWTRFSRVLLLLARVKRFKMAPTESNGLTLDDVLASVPGADEPAAPPPATGYLRLCEAPMPTRFLFAATMFPDTLPQDAGPNPGFVTRLTLIPKLMALARLSGVYPSRLLRRTVAIEPVMQHLLDARPDESATELLLNYFQARFWQRALAGTRLPFVAGVHQHILDLAAVLFLARAEALHHGLAVLSLPCVGLALQQVEFHLANQTRLFEHTLGRWIKLHLSSLDLAYCSLRLMAPIAHEATVPVPPEVR